MLAGAIAPIIIQPTVGVISDYTVTRWGRRKPYIVVGSLFDVVFLAGLAFNNDFVAMVGFYFLLQVSSNFAQGPFQGYVPDLVPAKQVGTASGLMGLMLTLGTIAGVGIATLGGIMDNVPAATLALGVVEVATMVVLVATVDEGRAAPKRTRPWREIALLGVGARHPPAARRPLAAAGPAPVPRRLQRDADRHRLLPTLPGIEHR